MSYWLKQSTAVTIKFGPFVDENDGKTAETGLTIAQADIRLSKNGGNIAQTNNATGGTHDELGFYDIPLDTTDTGTLGSLLVAVHESGALPVFQYFMVVPANVWDSMFGADKLDVSVTQWLGTAPAALVDTDKVATQPAGFHADAKAEINAEADTALADAGVADPPTKAEMDTAHGLLATEAKQDTIDTVVDAIKAVTDLLPDAGALSTIDGIVDAIKAVTDLLPDAGALDDLAAILVDTEDIQSRLPAALSGGYMKSDVQTWLTDIPAVLSGTHLQARVSSMGTGVFTSTTATAEARQLFALTLLLYATSDIETVGSARRTLYEVIAALTHKREISGTDILLYKANDTDVLATVPITTDSGQDPISSIDPPA